MTNRTYTLEDVQRARREWKQGRFSDEWRPYAKLAQLGGIIYPPEGTRWDTWEDDEPSQRALLVRAIRETPDLLRASIIGARSWGEVIGRLLKGRDTMREDATLRDRDDAWRRRDEPSAPQALQSIAAIVGRIRESVG